MSLLYGDRPQQHDTEKLWTFRPRDSLTFPIARWKSTIPFLNPTVDTTYKTFRIRDWQLGDRPSR
ncbi:MAG: hypothetical protein SNJ57_10395 [Cyanobacteriota bacterium]